MAYFGVFDLMRRWCKPPVGRGIYTRRGIEKIMRRPDFPDVSHVVNEGRTSIWRIADIEAYEQTRPWLRDETEKHKRQVGYARGNFKKKARQQEQARP